MRNRFNEDITEDSVLLYGDDGELREVPREEALNAARSRGLDLVEEWEPAPAQRQRSAVICRVMRVRRPLLWEHVPNEPATTEPNVDAALWFEAGHCQGRHYILVSNPHTFVGRFAAWCPTKKVGFCASKSEITACSREAEYFLKGLLCGQEPGAPVNDQDDLLPPTDPEVQAWAQATELLQATGFWNARLRVCRVCGARLLPSNPRDACWGEHLP